MLSSRELAKLRKQANDFQYPQVDAELLKELLDFYEQHQPQSKSTKKTGAQVLITEDCRRGD